MKPFTIPSSGTFVGRNDIPTYNRIFAFRFIHRSIHIMKSLKSVIGLTLLLCLILPALGTYSWLQFQKSLVRKEVKERMVAGLTKEELVLLKFTRAQSETELLWEHSREFEYKNAMYDVVETEVRGDSIFYWCWWDREESELNRRLENLIAQETGHNPQSREILRNLDNFSQVPYLPAPINRRIPDFPGQTLPSEQSLSCSSLHPSPPVPPPERV